MTYNQKIDYLLWILRGLIYFIVGLPALLLFLTPFQAAYFLAEEKYITASFCIIFQLPLFAFMFYCALSQKERATTACANVGLDLWSTNKN